MPQWQSTVACTIACPAERTRRHSFAPAPPRRQAAAAAAQSQLTALDFLPPPADVKNRTTYAVYLASAANVTALTVAAVNAVLQAQAVAGATLVSDGATTVVRCLAPPATGALDALGAQTAQPPDVFDGINEDDVCWCVCGVCTAQRPSTPQPLPQLPPCSSCVSHVDALANPATLICAGEAS